MLALIDQRLAVGETDGWHYDDMPEDGQAWRDDPRRARPRRRRTDTTAAASPRSSASEQAALIQAVQDLAEDGEQWHELAGQARVEPVDALRLHRVLLPPLGVERDRLPGAGLPARLPQPRRRRARTLGGRRPDAIATRSRSPTASRRPAPSTHDRARATSDRFRERSDYAAIRARNESAWLIPNDGSRTDHRLRADMRRYADDDEVDLVVVGAGAGGGVLTQRLARAGWRVVCLDAGPFWDPDTDWVSDERGVAHAVLDRTAPDRRQRPGAARLEQLRPRRRRLDGALRRLHPALPPVGLPHLHRATASAPTGRSSYADLQPYYAAIEHELPVAGEDWPWGDPHRYPHHPHPVGGNGEIFLRGARAAGHRGAGRPGRDPQRPLRQPAALHLPRLLPAGLQGQRQGQPADHPHPRRARARRRDPPRQHGHPRRRRRPHRHGHRRRLPARRPRAPPAGPRRRRRAATPSRRRGCCCSRPPTAIPTASATTTTRSAAT